MTPAPKARSVTATGQPDDWTPPRGWRREVQGDGQTRLVVSVPPEELAAVHLRLVRALAGPLGVLYVRLTDRVRGLQLPTPERHVAMELPADRVEAALLARPELTWGDARHQLWLRGKYGEQVVLDEMGLLYAYPDDPSFRDALAGLPTTTAPMLDARDYVKVEFLAAADAQEASLLAELGLRVWGGR